LRKISRKSLVPGAGRLPRIDPLRRMTAGTLVATAAPPQTIVSDDATNASTLRLTNPHRNGEDSIEPTG
jgi:hypothetical protein